MKEDPALGRLSFTQWRLGVSTSEAAVILAMNLLHAHSRIEACIAASLCGCPPPIASRDPCTAWLSNNALARLTEGLRVEGRTDKNAPTSPGPEENHNSKELVKRTRQRIDGGEFNQALAELLIDPSFYFRREFCE